VSTGGSRELAGCGGIQIMAQMNITSGVRKK